MQFFGKQVPSWEDVASQGSPRQAGVLGLEVWKAQQMFLELQDGWSLPTLVGIIIRWKRRVGYLKWYLCEKKILASWEGLKVAEWWYWQWLENWRGNPRSHVHSKDVCTGQCHLITSVLYHCVHSSDLIMNDHRLLLSMLSNCFDHPGDWRSWPIHKTRGIQSPTPLCCFLAWLGSGFWWMRVSLGHPQGRHSGCHLGSWFFAMGTRMPVQGDSTDKSDRQPTLCRVVIHNSCCQLPFPG